MTGTFRRFGLWLCAVLWISMACEESPGRGSGTDGDGDTSGGIDGPIGTGDGTPDGDGYTDGGGSGDTGTPTDTDGGNTGGGNTGGGNTGGDTSGGTGGVDTGIDTGYGDCPVPPAQLETSDHGGYSTRYWDCCKAHCSWKEHATSPLRICGVDNQLISNDVGTWEQARSGCEDGPAYTCWDMSPWAVCDTVSYGFVATAGNGGVTCGTCFELVFDGSNRQAQYGGNPDAGSRQLQGKRMIVQATNIGYDVGSGHFDIMIPGGGVGAFPNGCPRQWGTSDQNLLGAQSGGFLTSCQQRLGWEASHDALKNCVVDMCTALFSDTSRRDLLTGCLWYANWFGAADNPTFRYRMVSCPADLRATGM